MRACIRRSTPSGTPATAATSSQPSCGSSTVAIRKPPPPNAAWHTASNKACGVETRMIASLVALSAAYMRLARRVAASARRRSASCAKRSSANDTLALTRSSSATMSASNSPTSLEW